MNICSLHKGLTSARLGRWSLISLLALMIISCGSGGGGSDSPDNGGNDGGHGVVIPDTSNAPFGMSARPTLSALSFPTQPTLGAVTLADPVFQNYSGSMISMLPLPGSSKLLRIFQNGLVEVLDSSTETTATFLNVSVATDAEQGLIGLAIDPSFTSNRYFYLHYTRYINGVGTSRVSRFTANSGLTGIESGSEKVLFEAQYENTSHKAGALAFDKAGNLYIALGDDHVGSNAQDLTSYYGKILRIRPNYSSSGSAYSIPSGNPYATSNTAKREIWAYGFRNPYKMSIDTDDSVWVGDVGENSYEEINIVTAGKNYGWPYYEGNHATGEATSQPASAFTKPWYEYPHSEGQCIIGGFVYRGTAIPGLVGQYIFGDFVQGTIYAVKKNSDGSFTRTQIGAAGTAEYFAGFGKDASNEIYALSQGARKIIANGSGSEQSFPAALSDTGLFNRTDTFELQEGAIPYDVNSPLWSDNSIKSRWMAIPNNQTITYSPSGNWSFPTGTVLVKHFSMEMKVGDASSRRRLETRVLVQQVDGSWRGATYRWRTDQQDADLLESGADETLTIEENGSSRQQTYHYPSNSECMACHSQVSGRVLGVRSEQLNRNRAYPEATDNQLRTLNHIGMFDYNIGTPSQYPALSSLDSTASLESRARSYLASNCSFCHQPNGPTPVNMDFRFSTATSAMNAVDITPANTLGVVDLKIIFSGDKTKSAVYQRMNSRDANIQMPPVGSSVVDSDGLSVVGEWIDSLQ